MTTERALAGPVVETTESVNRYWRRICLVAIVMALYWSHWRGTHSGIHRTIRKNHRPSPNLLHYHVYHPDSGSTAFIPSGKRRISRRKRKPWSEQELGRCQLFLSTRIPRVCSCLHETHHNSSWQHMRRHHADSRIIEQSACRSLMPSKQQT